MSASATDFRETGFSWALTPSAISRRTPYSALVVKITDRKPTTEVGLGGGGPGDDGAVAAAVLGGVQRPVGDPQEMLRRGGVLRVGRDAQGSGDAAVGSTPRPSLVLLAFCAAQVLTQIPITPGGLGFVEAGLTAMLALAGVSTGAAVLATFAYRLFSFWLPLPVGLLAYGWHMRAVKAAPA